MREKRILEKKFERILGRKMIFRGVKKEIIIYRIERIE